MWRSVVIMRDVDRNPGSQRMRATAAGRAVRTRRSEHVPRRLHRSRSDETRDAGLLRRLHVCSRHCRGEIVPESLEHHAPDGRGKRGLLVECFENAYRRAAIAKHVECYRCCCARKAPSTARAARHEPTRLLGRDLLEPEIERGEKRSVRRPKVAVDTDATESCPSRLLAPQAGGSRRGRPAWFRGSA